MGGLIMAKERITQVEFDFKNREISNAQAKALNAHDKNLQELRKKKEDIENSIELFKSEARKICNQISSACIERRSIALRYSQQRSELLAKYDIIPGHGSLPSEAFSKSQLHAIRRKFVEALKQELEHLGRPTEGVNVTFYETEGGELMFNVYLEA